MICLNCGFTPEAEAGSDWGYLDGPTWWDHCEHTRAMRRCAACSARWWRPGMVPEWDIDGCAHEDCPACLSTLGDDGHYHEAAQPVAVRA